MNIIGPYGYPIEPPEGAVAYKYADPIEKAKWIYDKNEAVEIEKVDASLIEWVNKND